MHLAPFACIFSNAKKLTLFFPPNAKKVKQKLNNGCKTSEMTVTSGVSG